MSPFPKMGIMKRTTKGKEYAWLYDLRVCLKQNCDESNGTDVPEQYKNNVFLYDMALYLYYENLYQEGKGTEKRFCISPSFLIRCRFNKTSKHYAINKKIIASFTLLERPECKKLCV